VSAHAEFLRAATTDAALATQIKSDFRKAKLSGQDFRMLEFVEKLSLYPWMVVANDIQGLIDIGFSELEILHVVLGCSHFNYLNRIADGVGIQFEYHTDLPDFEISGADSPEKESFTRGASSQPPSFPPLGPWIDYPRTQDLRFGPDEPRLLFLIMGSNPDAQSLVRAWRAYQLAPSPNLDARFRCQLALYVSGINYCEYSCAWFMQTLKSLGESASAMSQLSLGQRPAHLSDMESCLFDLAQLLTQEAWKTTESHIENFRAHGLDDRTLLKVMMLVSYVNFENRVALGLGLPPESPAE
jgi:alkylhydroperoxidase family enzyme